MQLVTQQPWRNAIFYLSFGLSFGHAFVLLYIFMYAGGEGELCDDREGLATPLGSNQKLFFPPAVRPLFGLAKS
jgi:hypothetical protein